MIAFKDGKDGYYQFDWDGVSPLPKWTSGMTQIAVTPKDPAVVRAQKISEVKAERDRRKANGGFLVGTLWFRSDAESLALYVQMLTMAVEQALLPTYVFRTAWRSMSGATTPMTVALVRQIRNAGLITLGLIDDNAQAHIVAIGLSATPESYNYSTGWPPTYN